MCVISPVFTTMAVVGAVIVAFLRQGNWQRKEPQLTHGCTVGKFAVCWAVLALGNILLYGKIKLSILGKSGFSDFVPRSGTHLTSLSLKGVMPASLGIASEHLTVRSRPWSYAEVALSGVFQTPELLRANGDWQYRAQSPLLASYSGGSAAGCAAWRWNSAPPEGPAWGRKSRRLQFPPALGSEAAEQ